MSETILSPIGVQVWVLLSAGVLTDLVRGPEFKVPLSLHSATQVSQTRPGSAHLQSQPWGC